MDAQVAARRWAATWTAAWQAHDVEAVVALYAEDCVHRSSDYWHLQEGHHQPPPAWER